MSPAQERIKVLSEQVRRCAVREQHARQRLRAGRSQFFGHPTNLLLPFCTGMLVAARFSRRVHPPDPRETLSPARKAGYKTAWFSVLINALATGFRFYTRYLATAPAPQPAKGGAEREPDRSRLASVEGPAASSTAP